MPIRLAVSVAFLAACLGAQHVRVKYDKTLDFSAPRTVVFRPGLMHGHHPRIDEAALRRAVEERISRHAAAKGLKESPRGEWRLTYSLTVREAVQRERRGGRQVMRDVTEYTLQVRLVDAAGQEPWSTIATGTVEDRRHKYVEEHVLRAVTFSMAKYPPKTER